MGKYYVVWNGLDTGVFDSWDEVKPLIEGYSGARYKSYPSRQQAIDAYRGDPAEQMGILKSIAGHESQFVNYAMFPEIRLDALAVDAACSRNPGPVEYRGVWVGTGVQYFHVGPLAGGTNNIGEFLALIHALALLAKNGRTDIPIYTDSRTARSWLRNRRVKTSLVPTPENQEILAILNRAERWMLTNPIMNPILVWDTDRWGEIPADFGRK